jgi:hypothetical protein
MAFVATKSLFASKTVWVNVISAVVMFLEGQEFLNVIPDTWEALLAALVFGLNIILRFITTQPVTISGNEKVSVPD